MGILRLGKLCYWVIPLVRGFIPFFEREERVVKGSLKLYWAAQLLLHTDPPCQGQRRNLKGTSDSPFDMRYAAVWRDLRPQPLSDERRTQELSALGFRPIFPGHRLWLWLWIGSPSLLSSKELFSVETKASEAAAAATKSSQRDSIKSGTRRNFGFALGWFMTQALEKKKLLMKKKCLILTQAEWSSGLRCQLYHRWGELGSNLLSDTFPLITAVQHLNNWCIHQALFVSC